MEIIYANAYTMIFERTASLLRTLHALVLFRELREVFRDVASGNRLEPFNAELTKALLFLTH